MLFSKFRSLTALLAFLVFAFPFTPANSSETSPKMKKDMADMYQKMADCMRTDKSMHECHKEMMKDCPVAKATGSCPIMDGMKGMKNGKIKGMDHVDHK